MVGDETLSRRGVSITSLTITRIRIKMGAPVSDRELLVSEMADIGFSESPE